MTPPVLLLHKAVPNLLPIWRPHLGRLVSPRHYPRIIDTAYAGFTWAADNDCFQGLDETLYCRMLDMIRDLPNCAFVTAPDVVADADTTATLFEEWWPELHETNLPVALVAQDGLTVADVPWSRIGCLFIGGTSEWKYSDEVHRLAAECRRRKVWLHFGRVNSIQRAKHVAALGGNSFDGSGFSKFTNQYVPRMLDFLASPPQLSMLS